MQVSPIQTAADLSPGRGGSGQQLVDAFDASAIRWISFEPKGGLFRSPNPFVEP